MDRTAYDAAEDAYYDTAKADPELTRYYERSDDEIRSIGRALHAAGWLTPDEASKLRAALDLERSRRTLGGTPPPSDQNWANQKLPPPETATTGPVSPPGMRASNDHLVEQP